MKGKRAIRPSIRADRRFRRPLSSPGMEASFLLHREEIDRRSPPLSQAQESYLTTGRKKETDPGGGVEILVSAHQALTQPYLLSVEKDGRAWAAAAAMSAFPLPTALE